MPDASMRSVTAFDAVDDGVWCDRWRRL